MKSLLTNNKKFRFQNDEMTERWKAGKTEKESDGMNIL